MEKLTKEQLEEIVGTLHIPQRQYKTAWRIRVGGHFVSTRSGKNLWKRRGDAMSALSHHFSYTRHGRSTIPRGISNKEIAKQLIDNGYIEIVEVPIDD